MTPVGTLYTNPVSGETLRFEQIELDCVTVEICAPPGFPVPPRHVHPRSAERFEVVEGLLVVRAGAVSRTLEPGEAMTAQAGVPHGYAVEGPGPARFRVELTPPGGMVSFFSGIYGLAEVGPLNARGQPPLLSVAGVAADHLDDVVLAGVPVPAQRLLLLALARLGRLRRPR